MQADIKGIPVIEAKGCGSCSLCCNVLIVKATDSPAGEWCRHHSPERRCGIYDKRPHECRHFECGWLQSQGRAGEELPGELRPDRCHAVLMPMEGGSYLTVHVDRSQPEAWSAGALGQYLHRVSAHTRITIVIGKIFVSMTDGKPYSYSTE